MMMKHSWSFLFLAVALVILGSAGILVAKLYNFSPYFEIIVNGVFPVGKIAALLLMFQKSALRSEGRHVRLIYIFTGIALIATVFILEHLPSGRLLLYAAFLGIAMVYFFHFLRKRKKRSPDFVKLLWVLTWSSFAVFKLEHLPGFELLVLAEMILFFLMFLLFILEQWQQKSLKTNMRDLLEKRSVDRQEEL